MSSLFYTVTINIVISPTRKEGTTRNEIALILSFGEGKPKITETEDWQLKNLKKQTICVGNNDGQFGPKYFVKRKFGPLIKRKKVSKRKKMKRSNNGPVVDHLTMCHFILLRSFQLISKNFILLRLMLGLDTIFLLIVRVVIYE